MMSLCPNPDPELQTDHQDAHATNTRSLDGALGTRGGPTEPLESRIWAIPALTQETWDKYRNQYFVELFKNSNSSTKDYFLRNVKSRLL